MVAAQLLSTEDRQGRELAEILLHEAVEYAEHHWPIIPLRGKVPAIPSAHPAFKNIGCCTPLPPPDPMRGKCKGGCGKLGHGVYDATDDVVTVRTLWSGPYRGCNIGARVPKSMLLIDIDPRHGGNISWARMQRHYGKFPECLTTVSGRGGRRCSSIRAPSSRQADLRELGFRYRAEDVDEPWRASSLDPPGYRQKLRADRRAGSNPTGVVHRAGR